MVEEKIKKWIEKKLDQGVEPDRIKESLENTGKDPSLVDEVVDPFEEDQEDEERKVFEEEDAESSASSQPSEEVENSDQESDNASNRSTYETIKQNISDRDGPSDKALMAGSMAVVLLTGLSVGILASETTLLSDHTGCMNQGVSIQELNVEDGQTVADVRVTRNMSTNVLQIYSGDEILGETTDTFVGDSTMTVDTVGDEAVFKPVDCEKYIFRQQY